MTSPGPVSRDQGGLQWWLDLVGCTHLALGFIFRGLCSGRATCRHINNHGNQGRQQGLETAAVKALGVSMHYHGAEFCHGHMTVEANDGGWAGGKHVNNWKG